MLHAILCGAALGGAVFGGAKRRAAARQKRDDDAAASECGDGDAPSITAEPDSPSTPSKQQPHLDARQRLHSKRGEAKAGATEVEAEAEAAAADGAGVPSSPSANAVFTPSDAEESSVHEQLAALRRSVNAQVERRTQCNAICDAMQCHVANARG